MKKLITYIIILIFFESCKSYTKDEINDYIFQESFLLINEKQDTIQIEFLDNCVKTYNWDYLIYEEWEIYENGGDIFIELDTGDYRLERKIGNELFFTNNSTNFRLIRLSNNIINPEMVKGKWVEERYSYLLSDTTLLPPPCLNYYIDTFLIPGVEFNDIDVVVNDFCYKQKWVYKVNLKFGVIRFGEYCTSQNQWKIIELKKDTLIVDRRYLENRTVRYEKDKVYIRHNDK